MFRRILREVGFRCLAGYAVLEEGRIKKLEKEGYILKDAEDHQRRMDTLHYVLKTLKNKGF